MTDKPPKRAARPGEALPSPKPEKKPQRPDKRRKPMSDRMSVPEGEE